MNHTDLLSPPFDETVPPGQYNRRELKPLGLVDTQHTHGINRLLCQRTLPLLFQARHLCLQQGCKTFECEIGPGAEGLCNPLYLHQVCCGLFPLIRRRGKLKHWQGLKDMVDGVCEGHSACLMMKPFQYSIEF